MRVCVTQADIDNGMRLVPTCCPIALALRAVMGEDSCVSVVPMRVSFRGLTAWNRTQVQLPEETTQFIRRFDAGIPVQPFEFELATPTVI